MSLAIHTPNCRIMLQTTRTMHAQVSQGRHSLTDPAGWIRVSIFCVGHACVGHAYVVEQGGWPTMAAFSVPYPQQSPSLAQLIFGSAIEPWQLDEAYIHQTADRHPLQPKRLCIRHTIQTHGLTATSCLRPLHSKELFNSWHELCNANDRPMDSEPQANPRHARKLQEFWVNGPTHPHPQIEPQDLTPRCRMSILRSLECYQLKRRLHSVRASAC